MVNQHMFDGNVINVNGDDNYLSYVIKSAQPRVFSKQMAATVTITTQSIDRSHDVVITKGIDLGNHARCPTVLLHHDRTMPVGIARDKLGTYTVKSVGDGRLDATTFFDQDSVIGEQAFRLVEKGVLGGASVGFIPKKISKGNAGDRSIKIYDACELLEYSHLAIPDNPDCLVQAIEKGFGGKRLVPELERLLVSMQPERSATVVGGWDASKSMQDYKKDLERVVVTGGYQVEKAATPSLNGKPKKNPNTPEDEPVDPMQPEDEIADTDNDGDVDQNDQDQNAEGIDDGMGLDQPMTAGAQFAHTLHDMIAQIAGFLDSAIVNQEHPEMKQAGIVAMAYLGKMYGALTENYGNYRQEYSHMPALPGTEDGIEHGGDMMGEDMDQDFDSPDGDEDIDDPMADATDETDKTGETDETDEKKPAKKKKPAPFEKNAAKKKALEYFVCKSRELWANFLVSHTTTFSAKDLQNIDSAGNLLLRACRYSELPVETRSALYQSGTTLKGIRPTVVEKAADIYAVVEKTIKEAKPKPEVVAVVQKEAAPVVAEPAIDPRIIAKMDRLQKLIDRYGIK